MSTHNESPPVCYGRQWGEQDQECQRCPWEQACKPEFLSANGMTPIAQIPSAPVQPPWPYPPPTAYTRAPIPPATTVARLPVIQQPTIPIPQTQQIQISAAKAIVQPAQSVLPVPQAHNPYFQQYYQPYTGESVPGRVGTFVLLRVLQTMFSEGAKFCEVWRPEPPSGN